MPSRDNPALPWERVCSHLLVVKPDPKPVFSYRDDPAVPAFDDAVPLTVMDGDCAVCTLGARMISRFDRTGEIRICPGSTPLGRALLAHYGINPDEPESWLYLIDGQAYTSIDAMVRVGRRCGGVGWALQVLRIFPRVVQDWLYARLVRNRYRWFGHADMCAVPDARLRARLMSGEPRC